MIHRTLTTSFLSLFTGIFIARSQTPTFTPPLSIPVSLAGNFMEPRTGHFHSGLDMRTEGREGLPVRAAGKGWVSRINISPWGYGKALYIDHPNGHTTVYGHLREFVGAIARAALDAQYKARSFSVDVSFKPGELPVQDGELVAFSGNTGGSSGPHLHFEVRRSSDQHALDPERFGLAVPDSLPPEFRGLRIDGLDTLARVGPYPGGAFGLVVDRIGGAYRLRPGGEPVALGRVGISVNVIDRYSGSSSTCGVRSLQVDVDSTTVFKAVLDEVDFGLQRYCNAYMDHALFKGKDLPYNRCYRLPNNRLAIYDKAAGDGHIELAAGERRSVTITAVDAGGNRSTLTFTLRGASAAEAGTWPRNRSEGTWFRHDRENILERPGLRFTLPALALYQDEPIACSPGRQRPPKGLRPRSPLHRLHDPLTPLHTPGLLALRPDTLPAPGLASKLLIVRLDPDGTAAPLGGTFEAGWISARTRSFGTFMVAMDTLPPVLTPLDIKPVLSGRRSINFKVTDDLSGLDQWTALLDGEWILFEYDPKRRILTHNFDGRGAGPGDHTLVVEVRDERGNSTERTFRFRR